MVHEVALGTVVGRKNKGEQGRAREDVRFSYSLQGARVR